MQAEALRPSNLEKLLWVFVGSTVNVLYTQDKKKRSNMLTVARFLRHFGKPSSIFFRNIPMFSLGVDGSDRIRDT